MGKKLKEIHERKENMEIGPRAIGVKRNKNKEARERESSKTRKGGNKGTKAQGTK